jgi:citrate lyase subunit alpha/citrate CoA-transferase
MRQKLQLVKNSAGRKVPSIVNGIKASPYKGVGKYSPKGVKAAPPIRSCNNYPASGNKIANSLAEALKKCGIKNGMTISNHHHFRNGDLVMNQVFDTADKMGVKNLRWFPSAAFPCHEPMIGKCC